MGAGLRQREKQQCRDYPVTIDHEVPVIVKFLVLESMPILWVVASPAIQGIYLEPQAASSSISASEVLPREQSPSVRIKRPKV
jgi:hypothetical protein